MESQIAKKKEAAKAPPVVSTGPPAAVATAATAVAASASTAVAASAAARSWDPLEPEWRQAPPSKGCITRVSADLRRIFADPSPGICVIPDEDDICTIHALISGPFETPYEGGFFYFILRCPPDYPFSPPRVRLMTTGRGTVRFNPNLYQNGKVCLSILGTWQGPGWSSIQTISSVLISIQSLMNATPYHNEPGFEAERAPGDSKHYSDCIKHESFRVAAVGMLDKTACEVDIPEPFENLVREGLADNMEFYETVVDECKHMDGKTMHDPFGAARGKFRFAEILAKASKLL